MYTSSSARRCIALAFGLVACSSATKSTNDAGPDAGPALPCQPFDAGPTDATEAAAGYTVIQYYDCQKCHGGLLSGNPDGVQDPLTNNTQYPPNLTPDPATGLGCWSNEQITNAMLNNIDNQGQPICQPMPHFADAGMTLAQANEVVAYLRSIAPVVNSAIPTGSSCCAFDSDCLDGGYCVNRECVAQLPGSSTGSGASTTSAGSTTGRRPTGGGRTSTGGTTAGGSTSSTAGGGSGSTTAPGTTSAGGSSTSTTGATSSSTTAGGTEGTSSGGNSATSSGGSSGTSSSSTSGGASGTSSNGTSSGGTAGTSSGGTTS